MKTPSHAFALLAVLALATLAAAEETQFITHEQLELQDGRKLSEVVVRSFDPASGKVLLVARNTAMTVPIELLPADLAANVRAHSPKSGATFTLVAAPSGPEERSPPPNPDPTPEAGDASITAQPPEISTRARDDESSRATGVRRTERPTLPGPTVAADPVVTPPMNPAAEPRAVLERKAAHRALALAQAERYFRFEFGAGSGSVRVTALDFDVTETRPVTGWPGRFRTEGKAYLEFFDSKGNSFSRTSQAFEVVTQEVPGESPRVENFGLRR